MLSAAKDCVIIRFAGVRLRTNLEPVIEYDEIPEVITMLWTQDAISAEVRYRDEALRTAAKPRRARRRAPRSNRGFDRSRWTALFPQSSKEHG